MKHAVLLFWLISLPAVFAQQPASKKTPLAKSQSSGKRITPKPKTVPKPQLSEKEQFAKASAFELAADRVPALESFLTTFPESEDRAAAVELLLTSRILIAEEKLLSGDGAGAAAVFKLVIEQMPQPVPNDLFAESIAKIPSTLFFRGMRTQALELAAMIEAKVESNAAQLLEIANFHLATENGAEAMRVAAKALAKDPSSAAVHRTIALAHRINFDLDLSADSYARSLELDPESVASRRGLAEMKRALGKADEAVTLYRELLAKNESDRQSHTGLVLALFDAGKQSEAESEMAKSLEQTPGNVVLLGGAAYWYASKGMGGKAVELAEKAIAREPRYIWSHIALARGLMSQNKPVEAEQALVKARAYGNFPTLEYELASARMSAGFFREAVEELQKQFSVTPTGNIKTNLCVHVPREEKSLADLVAFERKASIFTPASPDTVHAAEMLRALLILDKKLQAPQPDETEVAAAADAFAAGSDKMKLHRQMYAASMLLQKRIAPAKALELAKAATGQAESALDVPNPRSAVLASELYEARAAAFRRNEFLLVPEVPTQTLSAILRGRIEETAGWALYQQNNFPDAVVRLRRAITVMPEKSAWWRSSMWRLGAALAADGKEAEALNAYIESYKTDKPDYAKYAVVEALYKKINGSVEGLEAKIGSDRVAVSPGIQLVQPTSTPTPVPSVETPAANTTNDAAPVISLPTPAVAEPVVERLQASPPKSQEIPKTEQVIDPQKASPAKSEEAPKTEPAAVEKLPEPKIEEPAKADPVIKDDPATQAPVSKDEPAKDRPIVKEEPPKQEPVLKEEPPKQEPALKEEPPKQEPISKELSKEEPILKEPVKEEPVSKDEPAKRDEAPPPVIEKVVEPEVETKVPETKSKPPDKEPGPAISERPQTKRPAENTAGKDSKRTTASKPLFEPIIITVPKARPIILSTDTAKNEKGTPTGQTVPGERERVVEGEEVKLSEVPPCVVGVSQENISLINDGGKIGILVSVAAPGDVKTLTANSSSAKDIEVSLEPEIGGIPDRRFYIIRSVSPTVGVYRVTFATECGKKNVTVTVR